MSGKTASKKNSKSMKENRDYRGYIHKVLKSNYAESAFTKQAADVANQLVAEVFFEHLMENVVELMKNSPRKTITDKDVICGLKLSIKPGSQLCTDAKNAASDAVEKYIATQAERKTKAAALGENQKLQPMARAKMAGLIFPITRTETNMMCFGKGVFSRKSSTAAVAMAAVMEFISTKIVELSVAYIKNLSKVRISPRALKMAIQEDPELNILFNGVIMRGGVRVHTEEALQPQKKAAKKPRVQEKSKARGKAKTKSRAKKQ
jgi:histone H2A